jgi:SWI/SNF-related matrix-associated actin-dependent regulator 1 of chromatin subfamily A
MSLLKLSSAETAEFFETGLAKELWPHQRAALEYVARTRRLLLCDEVGVGKTAVAIAAVQLLNAFPALIVVPAFLRYAWGRAIQEWLPETSLRVVEPGEPLSWRIEGHMQDFVVVSYNLLPKLVTQVQTAPFRALVCDESHAVKNPKAQRTKAVKRVATKIPLRILMTATPVENRPEELVSQLTILDQLEQFRGPWNFLQRYCNANGFMVKDPRGFWDFSGARNVAELNERLRSTCYVRRTKEQVHKNLPPLTEARVDLEVDNSATCTKAREDFIGWLNENAGPEVVLRAHRAEALARLSVLKRLASVGKRPAAEAWIAAFLENNPKEKLVLFTQLRETAAWYAEVFGAPVIQGGVPVKTRDRLIADFQAFNGIQMIVVNMEAGGAGIELFAASNCAFLELDWVPTTHTQAAGRLHRPGQLNPVTAWFLVGRGTVEEGIWRLLEEKARVVRATIEGGVEPETAENDSLALFLKGMES